MSTAARKKNTTAKKPARTETSSSTPLPATPQSSPKKAASLGSRDPFSRLLKKLWGRKGKNLFTNTEHDLFVGLLKSFGFKESPCDTNLLKEKGIDPTNDTIIPHIVNNNSVVIFAKATGKFLEWR